MQVVKRRLRAYLALFVLIMLIGTLGFKHLEDWSLSDAFYYNIVTVSTVGYGDIAPTQESTRMFAVILIVMGGASFLGVIANATELLLLRRENESRLRKVNMVLGVFFTELGDRLLKVFMTYDRHIEEIRPYLLVQANWTKEKFTSSGKNIVVHNPHVDIDLVDLPSLAKMLGDRRELLVNLLVNPVLTEQEDFSEALLAVFHLADELSSRDVTVDLPHSDREHLAGDMNRAYRGLLQQWLVYLFHLKSQYPYLFSLAIRKNPFDADASPIIVE